MVWSFRVLWASDDMIQGLIEEGTRLGDLLALLTTHMEELNKMTVEERCAVQGRPHLPADTVRGSLSPSRCRLSDRWRARL